MTSITRKISPKKTAENKISYPLLALDVGQGVVDTDEPDAFPDDLDGLYKDKGTLAINAVFVNDAFWEVVKDVLWGKPVKRAVPSDTMSLPALSKTLIFRMPSTWRIWARRIMMARVRCSKISLASGSRSRSTSDCRSTSLSFQGRFHAPCAEKATG